MNVMDIVNKLAEIKVKIQALQAEEKALLSSVGNGHAQRTKKSKISGWAKRKMSKAQKSLWANYTPAQRQARIKKALVGRGIIK